VNNGTFSEDTKPNVGPGMLPSTVSKS